MDVATLWDGLLMRADLVSAPPGLLTDRELESNIIVSLFTWRRAEEGDDLPFFDNKRYGWWGDSYPIAPNDKIGSRIWLFQRAKILQSTPAEFRAVCLQALEWLIEDGVATEVEVVVERLDIHAIAASITVARSNGTTFSTRFDHVWEQLYG